MTGERLALQESSYGRSPPQCGEYRYASLLVGISFPRLPKKAYRVAVDRKNKNNQLLFKGSFEGELIESCLRTVANDARADNTALQVGECIGVFPEGTSHTEPHMIPPKDGTSWAALEYLRYLEGTPENGGKKNGRKAVVVPVALCYTEKSKFRSRVVVQYVSPLSICRTCACHMEAATMASAGNAESTADMLDYASPSRWTALRSSFCPTRKENRGWP